MVPRRLNPWKIAALALAGLGPQAVVSASPIQTPTIQFTGNVARDFDPTVNPNVKITPVSDSPLTIGQSTWITERGWVSGWSIQDIRTYYDATTDTLNVGVNTFKNANGQYAPFGQANGDPTGKSTSYDPANMGGDKSIALAIAPVNTGNVSQPGAPVVVAGIPADKAFAGSGTNGFTVSAYDASKASSGLAYQFGSPLAQFTGNLAYNPSTEHPQLEFTIKNFSQIPGINPKNGFWISAYAGSSSDGVAGEAYLSWTNVGPNAEQNIPEPATLLAWTIVSTGLLAYRVRGRRTQA